MGQLSEYATKVVRLFPDYADSVIWFAIGPVPYERAHLSEELERDLVEWDASYYADGDPLEGWSSPQAADSFTQEGLRLARCLAEELGEDFEVEVDADKRGRRKIRFRGHSSRANPAAAAAFHELADQLRAQHDHIEELKAQGHSFKWTAGAPGDQ